MFTIVVPFFNGYEYLDRLLETIPDNVPVILADDQSERPLQHPGGSNVRVIRLKNKGYFTGAVNQGIKAAKDGDNILILNQDVWFENDNWINFIEEYSKDYDLIGERSGFHPVWKQGYIHGTFMYIKRAVIDKIGLMDAEFFPLWGSTCEYQLRACRAGFSAYPVREIPGFVHQRTIDREQYGSSINQFINENYSNRWRFLRTPPVISVVINAYNHGRYLDDAVNSLIGGQTSLGEFQPQTFQGFEVVIVDDASTDNTPEICERLADEWKGIRFIRHDENKGSAAAMNTGIKTCRSHFIAAMDSDDMMDSDRLRMMLRCAEKNPRRTVYDSIIYFGNGQIGVQFDKIRKHKWLPEKYDYEDVITKNTIHKGILFPKRAWEDVGGYPEKMKDGREDWGFNVGLGRVGWCGVHVKHEDGSRYAGYYYRREGQNRTLTNTTPASRSTFLKQIQQTYPDIYRGERPMGCCGRGAASVAKTKSTSISNQSLPGEQDGMILLEYIGGNWGTEIYIGSETGTYYEFSKKKNVSYVDKNDAGDQYKGLLSLSENGKRLFKIHQPPKPALPRTEIFIEEDYEDVPVVEVAPEDQLPTVSIAEKDEADVAFGFVDDDVVDASAVDLPDIENMNVSDIKEEVVAGLYTDDEILSLIEAEKSGKNRITAISHLEGLLNE